MNEKKHKPIFCSVVIDNGGILLENRNKSRSDAEMYMLALKLQEARVRLLQMVKKMRGRHVFR